MLSIFSICSFFFQCLAKLGFVRVYCIILLILSIYIPGLIYSKNVANIGIQRPVHPVSSSFTVRQIIARLNRLFINLLQTLYYVYDNLNKKLTTANINK